LLDRLMGHALNYYEDFVKPTKSYRLPDDREKAALLDLATRLKALPADTTDGELIQTEVYAVGKDHAFEPLRGWFGALYEVLLGASQGPRFGSFAAIFGLPQTIELIEAGANGSLAGA
jgi:lysyl-tRNA synthetase class 1